MPFLPIAPGQCASMIKRADAIAVLTGAGMSTAAGVPDFRGPKGLYVTRAYDPETVFEIRYFDKDPEPFYKFSRDFLGLLAGIEPTFTHRFLARLELSGKDVAIITQNIDGLHQRAGSRHVLPMHGDYETAHCRRCGHGMTGVELRELMETQTIPQCPDCGGVMKPDVVFFGENVLHLDEAARLAASADLFMALGSSLAVYPAALLPEYAGGDVVIVNKGVVALRTNKQMHHADMGLDEFFKHVQTSL